MHWRSSGKTRTVRHTPPPRSANPYSNGEWRERRSHPGINCPLRRPVTATPRARARSRSARRPATRTDLCLDDHTGRVAGKYEKPHPHALAFDHRDHSMASLRGYGCVFHNRRTSDQSINQSINQSITHAPITVNTRARTHDRYESITRAPRARHLCAWGYIRRCEVLTDRGILLVENFLSIPKSRVPVSGGAT